VLTTEAKGRAIDFNRVVGGRIFRGLIHLSLGTNNEVYAICRDAYNQSGIYKFFIGNELEDETEQENILSFGPDDPALTSEGGFTDSWPTCSVYYDGQLFVTDELRNTIRVFDTEGNSLKELGLSTNISVDISTDNIHGSVSSNTPSSEPGKFNRPSGITVDSQGDLLVSDTLNHRIQKISKNGSYISSFGKFGNSAGEFNSPWGICLDDEDNIFVADHLNNRIQKFDSSGNHLLSFGDKGTVSALLDHPSDVAVDPDGDIYVTSWAKNKVNIYDSTGTYLLELLGSAQELSKWQRQYVNASPDVQKARRRVASLEPEMLFALPSSVQFDKEKSNILIVDSQRWRIQIFEKLKKYSEPQFNI
jgi:DNA-binding beta-propeller fold protein YncE